MRQLRGEEVALSDDELAKREALQSEYDELQETYTETEELPEEIAQRFADLELALAGFEDRPIRFDLDEIARAGAFISIDGYGRLRVERGFVRPEDEPTVEPERKPTSSRMRRSRVQKLVMPRARQLKRIQRLSRSQTTTKGSSPSQTGL